MITKKVKVESYLDVTIDETKFTPEFLAMFSHVFYPSVKNLDDHIKSLAEVACYNHEMNYSSHFQEGYGKLGNMGIKIDRVITDVEITD